MVSRGCWKGREGGGVPASKSCPHPVCHSVEEKEKAGTQPVSLPLAAAPAPSIAPAPRPRASVGARAGTVGDSAPVGLAPTPPAPPAPPAPPMPLTDQAPPALSKS